MDPDGPLFAQRMGDRWRNMDDPALAAGLLERSNAGMGMLVLNRSQGVDLPLVNDLYTRLRNLEVNSFKRFVGLTGNDPGPFCLGLDPKELLLAATVAQTKNQKRHLPYFSRVLLWHCQELAHLVYDYRKPIACQAGGASANEGAALASLAWFSGVYEDSEIRFDACHAGLVPMGGASWVLARLPFHFGRYLALTGRPLRGVDIIYAGLSGHWMAPQALPFLELTAEKHLEVSEADSRALLDEHSLSLPAGFNDPANMHENFVPLIKDAFGKETVPDIVKALRTASEQPDADAHLKNFALECASCIERAAPLAAHFTLELIKRAEKQAKLPQGAERDRGFREALARELRVQQHLLCKEDDTIVGLHARCMGRIRPDVPQDVPWRRRGIKDVTSEEKDIVFAESRFGEAEDFPVHERSDISLSSHPRLRRYHPDYNPKTGLDHDPAWLREEAKRWDPGFCAEERQLAMRQLLGGADPARYGQERFVRSTKP